MIDNVADRLFDKHYGNIILKKAEDSDLALGVLVTYIIMTHAKGNPSMGITTVSVLGFIIPKFNENPQIGAEIMLGLRKFKHT